MSFCCFFSLFFYAWGEPKYVFLMLLYDHHGFLHTEKVILTERKRQGNQKAGEALLLMISITCGSCPSLDFLNMRTSSSGRSIQSNRCGNYHLLGNYRCRSVFLFLRFRQCHTRLMYIKGGTEVQKNWIKYGTYVSMFPQLIAGPIVQYKTIAEQMEHEKGKYCPIFQKVFIVL